MLEGRAKLEIGGAGRRVARRVVIAPGRGLPLPARDGAPRDRIEDTRILEVSTPHLDDVVRLEDNYGREGT